MELNFNEDAKLVNEYALEQLKCNNPYSRRDIDPSYEFLSTERKAAYMHYEVLKG